MKVPFRVLLTLCTMAVMAAMAAPQASASTILTYTGPNFDSITDSPLIPGTYTTSMFVSAVLELPAALGSSCNFCVVTPLHFSISDGRSLLTDATSGVTGHVAFQTDSSGSIVGWSVQFRIGPAAYSISPQGIETSFELGGGDPIDDGHIRADTSPNAAQDRAFRQDRTPVSWTVSSVPEPATLSSLGIGIAGLAFLLKKKTF